MSSTPSHGGKPFWKWAPENSGIPDIPKEIKDKVVRFTRLVTHTMGAPQSKNHWTIFLVLSNTQSLHFNFRQGGEGEEDVMVVAVRAYITSNSAIQSWDFDCIGNQIVQTFLRSITSNKRYLFEFNSEGTGCRDWASRTMADFQNLQLIRSRDRKDSRTVSEILGFEYSKIKSPQPCPIDRGVWLSPQKGFTMLQRDEYRREGEDMIVSYQGNWVRVLRKDLSVKSGDRRIDIPTLKLSIQG